MKQHLILSRRQQLQLEQTVSVFKKRVMELVRQKGESDGQVENLVKQQMNNLIEQ